MAKNFDENSVYLQLVEINQRDFRDDPITNEELNMFNGFIKLFPEHIKTFSSIVNDKYIDIIRENISKEILFNVIECLNFPAINHLDNDIVDAIGYCNEYLHLTGCEVFEHLSNNGCNIDTYHNKYYDFDSFLGSFDESSPYVGPAIYKLIEFGMTFDLRLMVKEIMNQHFHCIDKNISENIRDNRKQYRKYKIARHNILREIKIDDNIDDNIDCRDYINGKFYNIISPYFSVTIEKYSDELQELDEEYYNYLKVIIDLVDNPQYMDGNIWFDNSINEVFIRSNCIYTKDMFVKIMSELYGGNSDSTQGSKVLSLFE